MCLESDKNRTCKRVQEGPCGLYSHTGAQDARLHWPISETAAWCIMGCCAPHHCFAWILPGPHCLEGHAQPLGLAYLPSSIFSLHIAAGPTDPPISKQASLQGLSAKPLLMPFILPGTPMFLPSKICLSQILSFLGSLEVCERA